MSGKDLHTIASRRLRFRLARHNQDAAFLVDLDVQILSFGRNRGQVHAAAPLGRFLGGRAIPVFVVGSIGKLAKDLVEKWLHVFVSKSEHFWFIFSLVCEDCVYGLSFIVQKR